MAGISNIFFNQCRQILPQGFRLTSRNLVVSAIGLALFARYYPIQTAAVVAGTIGARVIYNLTRSNQTPDVATVSRAAASAMGAAPNPVLKDEIKEPPSSEAIAKPLVVDQEQIGRANELIAVHSKFKDYAETFPGLVSTELKDFKKAATHQNFTEPKARNLVQSHTQTLQSVLSNRELKAAETSIKVDQNMMKTNSISEYRIRISGFENRIKNSFTTSVAKDLLSAYLETIKKGWNAHRGINPQQ